MFQYMPLQDLGIRFRLGTPELIGTLAVVLPLCPLIVAIQMYVATFAKSFKEAQSYLSFLMMAQMVPGMMATMNPMPPRRGCITCRGSASRRCSPTCSATSRSARWCSWLSAW